MGDGTAIEWTATYHPDGSVTRGASWNPLAAFDRETDKRGWFCTRVSDACKNCYAAALNQRLGTGHDYQLRNLDQLEFRLVNLDQPLRWKRPRKIFVNSMTDLFHEAVPDNMIDRVFAAMALASIHIYLVLTKRPERMAEYLTAPGRAGAIAAETGGSDDPLDIGTNGGVRPWPFIRPDDPATRWPLPHVWLGTSVENQPTADERIPQLLRTPAAVRWLSMEPLLGPVGLDFDWLQPPNPDPCPSDGRYRLPEAGIHWVVVGGESGGRHVRPMHEEWARSLRDRCQAAGVPFFFKQWGSWVPARPNQGLPADAYVPLEPDFPDSMADGVAYAGPTPKAGGRLLDGHEWNEYPEAARAE